MGDQRRFDPLERVVRDTRRELQDVKSTVLSRLASHTHPGGGGGDGGVTDHGQLTGLGDDDHPQYHNDARGDARYYTKSQVDSALGGKADTDHDHDGEYVPVVDETGSVELPAGAHFAIGDWSGASFSIRSPSETTPTMFASILEGETAVRWRVRPNGLMQWGSGQTAPDVTFSRTDVGEMTLESNLVVDGGLTVNGVGQVNIAVIAADSTVNNSTTMVDVEGLSVPVVAGAFYAVTAYVPYTAETGADLKLGWAAPGGSIMRWGIQGLRTSGSSTTGGPEVAGSTGSPLSVGGTGSEAVCSPIGTFIAGADGVLQMQMAQDTAHASDTTVHLGAWLRVERIS